MLPLLLEAAELAESLNNPDILVVDLCRSETFAQAHLPGAVHIEPASLVSGLKPATGRLPEKARLDALFSGIGYSPEKHIIAYDDEGGGWAGRFIWTLDVIGHKKSSLLNGGLHAWLAGGYPTTKDVTVPASVETDIIITTDVIAEKEDVLNAISDPDTVIWDARSAEEHAGTKVFAARGGHIPGAINLDWLLTMDRQNHLKLTTDLDDLLAAKGISQAKRIITHCQTHHRSGLTYFIGKLKGFQIKAYHGSWSEWGNDPTTPIETG